MMAVALVCTVATGGAAANVTINLVNHGIVLQDVPLRDYFLPAVVLAAVAMLSGVATAMIVGRVGYVVEFDLRTWVYTRIQNTPLSHLESLTSGQMLTRVQQDLAAVDELIQVAPAVVVLIPVILGLAVFVIVLNPIMGILAVAAPVINLLILKRMRGRLRGLSWMELNESAEVTTAVVEPVLGIRVVHAFHRAEEHRSRLAVVALRAYRVSMTKARLVAQFDLFLKSIPVLLNAVILFVGASFVSSGRLSIGTFGFTIELIVAIIGIATTIDQMAVLWQLLRGSQDRFLEMLRLPQLPPTTGSTSLPDPVEGLQMVGITVRRGGRTVLEGLDLSLAPGELVVVTGAPGSGKSTLAGVLAGHVVADAGGVSLEGHAWQELDPASAQEAVRVVSETSLLFAGTVRDNILMGVPQGLSKAELQEVLGASGALEVVGLLDGGIDAAVGDRGLTLSGGQRQRIALARALATRPRVLVLDDALSAVQPALEIELIAELRAFDPSMSILFITRRDNAASVADTVLALPEPELAPSLLGTAVDEEAAAQMSAGARAAAGESGLSLDPAMRALVGRMELSQDSPDVHLADMDDVPSVKGLARPFRKPFALGLGFLVVTTLTQTIPALLLGRIIEHATNGEFSGITSTALLTAGMGVLAGLAAYGYTVNTGLLTQGVTYLLRRQVFHRVSSLGVDYYDRELPGQVATRVVNDLGLVNTFLLKSLFLLIVQLSTVIVSLTMIGVVAPQVAVTVVLFGLALVTVTVVGTRLANRAYTRARLGMGVVMTRFEEDFSGVLEIRNLAAVDAQTHRFVAASKALLARRRRVVIISSLYSQSLTLIGTVASSIVLIQAGGLVVGGSLSVGLALTVQSLAKTATTPFSIFALQYTTALNTVVSWRRLKEFYTPPLLPVQRPDARSCPPLRGEVVFDGVVFRYPHTQRTVLSSLSATIPAGAVVALVGYTGAGKSSITKLLQRAYDPDLGAVRIDGVDLRDLELTTYRHRVGVVPQDAYLFRGTVASNIAYGNPSASREQVEAAAHKVGAGTAIESLPGGFEAYVAEGGLNLTGAQRQLVALARAWVAEPDVLVLDEATSALDAATERAVLAAVQSLGCTTLAVTHRESVVGIADHVLVIDAGRVVEAGSRDEVVGSGGAYDRLWRVLPSDLADEDVAVAT